MAAKKLEVKFLADGRTDDIPRRLIIVILTTCASLAEVRAVDGFVGWPGLDWDLSGAEDAFDRLKGGVRGRGGVPATPMSRRGVDLGAGRQPPMITVGHPGPGAIGVPCTLRSPSRAAGKPPISTVMLPIAIPLGTGDTHTIPPGTPLATAAGDPPISTVGTVPAGVMAPPTCGLGPSVSGHTTMSPARSAGPVGI